MVNESRREPTEKISKVSKILGKKWEAQLVYFTHTRDETSFSTLKRELQGISNKVLAEKLKSLSKHYIVRKKDSEYKLTEKGEGLIPVLEEMVFWHEKHCADGFYIGVVGSNDLHSAVEDLTEASLTVKKLASEEESQDVDLVFVDKEFIPNDRLTAYLENFSGMLVAVTDSEYDRDVANVFDSSVNKPLNCAKIEEQIQLYRDEKFDLRSKRSKIGDSGLGDDKNIEQDGHQRLDSF